MRFKHFGIVDSQPGRTFNSALFGWSLRQLFRRLKEETLGKRVWLGNRPMLYNRTREWGSKKWRRFLYEFISLLRLWYEGGLDRISLNFVMISLWVCYAIVMISHYFHTDFVLYIYSCPIPVRSLYVLCTFSMRSLYVLYIFFICSKKF